MIYALDGVKTYFAANLAGFLTTIETEETITIPRWNDLDWGKVTNRQVPYIEFLPDITRPMYSADENSFDNEHWDYHYIQMFVTFADLDQKQMIGYLLWYREAIRRLVKANNRFGGLFNRVHLGNSDYSPVIQSQTDKRLYMVLTQDLEVRAYK